MNHSHLTFSVLFNLCFLFLFSEVKRNDQSFHAYSPIYRCLEMTVVTHPLSSWCLVFLLISNFQPSEQNIRLAQSKNQLQSTVLKSTDNGVQERSPSSGTSITEPLLSKLKPVRWKMRNVGFSNQRKTTGGIKPTLTTLSSSNGLTVDNNLNIESRITVKPNLKQNFLYKPFLTKSYSIQEIGIPNDNFSFSPVELDFSPNYSGKDITNYNSNIRLAFRNRKQSKAQVRGRENASEFQKKRRKSEIRSYNKIYSLARHQSGTSVEINKLQMSNNQSKIRPSGSSTVANPMINSDSINIQESILHILSKRSISEEDESNNVLSNSVKLTFNDTDYDVNSTLALNETSFDGWTGGRSNLFQVRLH